MADLDFVLPLRIGAVRPIPHQAECEVAKFKVAAEGDGRGRRGHRCGWWQGLRLGLKNLINRIFRQIKNKQSRGPAGLARRPALFVFYFAGTRKIQ